MPIIACVLRTGGEYAAGHVHHLIESVALFAQKWERRDGVILPFVCLTDDANLVTREPTRCRLMQKDWPGWWSKLELFRPGLFPDGEAVLFFDLDTEIVGDLLPILDAADAVGAEHFIALEDFYRGHGTLQSSVMAWRAGGPAALIIWHHFTRDPQGMMVRHHGDQNVIEEALAIPGWRTWQAMGGQPDDDKAKFPGAFVSYKRDVAPIDQLPRGARVVVFHGQPRPWHVAPVWSLVPWRLSD